MRLALVGLVFALGTATMPVLADVQPLESGHKAHCNAALDANDWDGAIQYCTALAEDLAIDATTDTGDRHYLDILGEGVFISMVGNAHAHLGEHHDAADLYDEARILLRKVRDNSTNATLVNTANKELGILEGL